MAGYPPVMARIVCALLLILFAGGVLAWSGQGHRMTAELAQRQLTPAARAEVDRLLAGEREPSLGGVASWADTLRDEDPAYFRRTSNWHYVNARGGGCDVQMARDCANGGCVIGAIERQRAILADRSQPLAARRDALKFVVHFVGDVHQPMHAGNRTDAGGNRFQVSLRTRLEPEAYARDKYVDGVMGTNLHAVWDHYVLGESLLGNRAYTALLSQRAWPPPATRIGTPQSWARESCELIDAWGLYPSSHVIGNEYGAAMRPLAERRILQGAWRLSLLLNSALDPSFRMPADTP